MIVDCHVHLFPTEEVGLAVVEDTKARTGVGYYATGTPEAYIADMAKSGIDKAVVLSFAPDNQLKNMNFWTTAVTRPGKGKPAKYPMFLPFVSVSPTMKGRKPLEELGNRKGWGMRGLKIHPNAQRFSPDDPRMRPVYGWMVENGMPVTAHTGVNIVEDETTHMSEPNRWIPVLEEFPDLKLIMAHLGHGYWDQTLDIARRFPNVMFDTAVAISHIQCGETLAPAEAVEMVRAIGAHRIMFGSDYPWVDPGEDIRFIRSLALTEEEKVMILGRNAKRVFGL